MLNHFLIWHVLFFNLLLLLAIALTVTTLNYNTLFGLFIGKTNNLKIYASDKLLLKRHKTIFQRLVDLLNVGF